MTFQESHVTQLSSPTTCFSGLTSGLQSKLASTTHFVEIDESRQHVLATPISFPSDRFVCVGFTCSKEDQVHCILEQEDATLIAEESDGLTIDSVANESTATINRRQPTTSATLANTESTSNVMSDDSNTITRTFKAALVWQRLDQNELKLPLQTRPLSPHLTSDGLLWIGSADDCLLKCYRRTEREILKLNFEKISAFSFTSPIMRLTSITLPGGLQCLAVGCQDGTIRLLEYSSVADIENATSHTVIVDGPIISLHLCFMENKELQVLCGSMCGFVCRMTTATAMSWQGPDLILQGLWHGESDDAVLAVCSMTRHRIAIGTFAGWLYVVTHGAGKLVWKCVLPYAIHAIAQDNNKLIVTTKRTMHVFDDMTPPMLYSGSLAKERLEKILAEQEARRSLRNDEHATLDEVDESNSVEPESSGIDNVISSPKESAEEHFTTAGSDGEM